MSDELRAYERPATDEWVRIAYAQVQVTNARFALRQVLTSEQTEDIRDRANARFDAWRNESSNPRETDG